VEGIGDEADRWLVAYQLGELCFRVLVSNGDIAVPDSPRLLLLLISVLFKVQRKLLHSDEFVADNAVDSFGRGFQAEGSRVHRFHILVVR
jgi:hypothetical protein